MLIINDTYEIQESSNIYSRSYNMRGCSRTAIEIKIPKQDGVDYDKLLSVFTDGISIIRKEIKLVTKERHVSREDGADENDEDDIETYIEEEVSTYDLSEYCVAGDIIDKRDGSYVVYMGKKTETEILEEENAELMLMVIGGEI